MKSPYVKLAVATVLAGTALQANALIITEEYTGRQTVTRGSSYEFDFDLWSPNAPWFVNDNAPGLSLTTDGSGAFGPWSAATLLVDFSSSDREAEHANIDVDAWSFRFLGVPLLDTDLFAFNSVNVTPPGNGTSYLFSYDLNASQLTQLASLGGGNVRVGATNTWGNDFDITRVGLRVTTDVPEPATLALLAVGLLGAGYTARRRQGLAA